MLNNCLLLFNLEYAATALKTDPNPVAKVINLFDFVIQALVIISKSV
jgi:hypothetical protein